MSTSVLRRYTPPTCTLEIAAIGSALSRWTDRAVLKNLRFQLSFDDPKLPPDQQVTIRGDRNQLEALWEVVSTYIQNILIEPAPQSLSLGSATVDHPVDPVMDQAVDQAMDQAMDQSMDHQSQSSVSTLDQAPHLLTAHPSGVSLQPRGFLSHELALGTLATEESGSVIQLSALQLFDLANALDDYYAEVMTLPSLGRARWSKAPVGWMQAAAAAVLVVGVSVPVARFVMDVSSPNLQTATAPTTREIDINSARRPMPPSLPIPTSPGATPPPLVLTPLTPPAAPPVGVTEPPAVTAPVLPPQPTIPDSVQPEPKTTIEIPAETEMPSIPAPAAAPSVTASAPPRLEGITEPGAIASSNSPASASTLEQELGAAGLSADSAAGMASSSAARSAPMAASPSAAAENSTSGSLSQVAEVKDYFQQRWSPPAELTETLEYRLLLNADGSLQRIVPLGESSANFLDRTNMPLMGEPFVSPTSDGTTPQIRLVLGSDGKVQTFLEYAN
ncbi:MAG: DUF4335 domain-containing protein [Oculatellaceae cyanobacterium Prado106]|jgi:hypothetical protein|nr:DUF4335 domain-containing protein [Oculatellaceae cyanobacterium Prado106]